MSQPKPKNQNYDLQAYINDKPQKIGYGYQTKGGNICIRAGELMDDKIVGASFKVGLFIEAADFKDIKDYQGSTLTVYVNNKTQTIGHTAETEKGNIGFYAHEGISDTKLGKLLKAGVYVKRLEDREEEYDCFADEMDPQNGITYQNDHVPKFTSAAQKPKLQYS